MKNRKETGCTHGASLLTHGRRVGDLRLQCNRRASAREENNLAMCDAWKAGRNTTQPRRGQWLIGLHPQELGVKARRNTLTGEANSTCRCMHMQTLTKSGDEKAYWRGVMRSGDGPSPPMGMGSLAS